MLGPDQLVRKIAFPTAQGGAGGVRRAVDPQPRPGLGDHRRRRHRPTAAAQVARAARGRRRRSTRTTPAPPRAASSVVKSFGPTKQSPGGWLDPTGLVGLPGITTLGNNANTAIAWTVPLVAVDQYNRPVSPTGSSATRSPTAGRSRRPRRTGYQADANAAATNLFYHHNRIHDEYYEFGFTESGGNFQLVNKPGTAGLGGDPVFGGAQSGALNLTESVLALGRNNANMLTLPDGIPGFTNMYLWEFVDDVFEGPNRDGDFDATIIQHEYSHGLSNRYVGGGGLGSLGTTQSGAMGEGWGDWFAMNDLFRRGLTRTAVTAPYVGDPQRGIRNWNYATSPATYGDYGYDMSGPEVHSDGEIWTATLWTLRTKILKAVGGNQKAGLRHRRAPRHGRDAALAAVAVDARHARRDRQGRRAPLRQAGTPTSSGTPSPSAASASRPGPRARPTPTRCPASTSRRRRSTAPCGSRSPTPRPAAPVKGVRVLGGLFEGRGTPIVHDRQERHGLGALRRRLLHADPAGARLRHPAGRGRPSPRAARTAQDDPAAPQPALAPRPARPSSRPPARPARSRPRTSSTTPRRPPGAPAPRPRPTTRAPTSRSPSGSRSPRRSSTVAVSVVKPIGVAALRRRQEGARPDLERTAGRGARSRSRRFSLQPPRARPSRT